FPISCAGVCLVFLWARELYGPTAALGSATIYALDPSILAHGSLVGTDVGAAVAILLALWLWNRFCQQPSARRALLAAIAVALAHGCKFSALLLWPAMAVMGLCWMI